MIPSDASAMVTKLKGLYPKMGAEQISFWAVNFVSSERSVVSDCIDKLARLYGPEECPSRPVLLGMIQTEEEKTGRQQSFIDQEHRKQRERERETEIIAAHREADRYCERLTEESLIAARDELMTEESTTPHMRALLGHRNPRESAMLRDLIYAHMEKPLKVGAK